MLTRATILAAVALLSLVGGCNNPTVNNALNAAKQQGEKLGQQAKETIDKGVSQAKTQTQKATGQAGSMSLTLQQPVTTSACYASLVTSSTRPAVLVLANYKPSETRPANAVYLRATVQAKTIAELGTGTVSAEMFAKTGGSDIWYSRPGEPVQLEIESFVDNTLKATLRGGKLYHTDSTEVVEAAGSLEAVTDQ